MTRTSLLQSEHVTVKPTENDGVHIVFSDRLSNILDTEPGDTVGIEVVATGGSDVSIRVNFDDLSLTDEQRNALADLTR